MNFIKRYLIFIVIFLIILSGCSNGKTFNDEGLTFEYNDYLNVLEDKFYFKQLNDNQKKIYMCLYDASVNFEHSFEYQFPYIQEDHDRAFNAFINDWPEYFWWPSLENTISEQFGKTTVKSISDYLYVDNIKDYYSEMTNKINEIVNNIEGEDDYNKIKFLHDYMINSFNYDNDFFNNLDEDSFNSNNNIYKLLKDNAGTNRSYALLFSTLASKLGYECYYVGAENDDTLCHDMININNNYYYVDVATDDCISENSKYKYEKYLYFLTNDEIESATHISDKLFSYPKCENDDYYMFNLPGKFFQNYDEKTIIDFIVKCIKNKDDEIILVFNNADDTIKIYDYLFGDDDGFFDLYRKRISSYYNLTTSYNYNDSYYYVIFTYKNKS